jgi:hypothetical protein
MAVGQDAQTSNENLLPLQKIVLGNSKSSITKIRSIKNKHSHLKQIFILSLELTISMVLVGGALMVAINGMTAGPPMP